MSFEMANTIIAGGVISVLARLLTDLISRRKNKPVTLEQRIETLTSALTQSSRLVSEVESEIQSRRRLVDELKRDAVKYQALVSINQEQVQAVAQVLKGELRREGKGTFWKGVFVNFIFFILGVVVSLMMQ